MSQIKKDLSELIERVNTLTTQLNTLSQTIERGSNATKRSAKTTNERASGEQRLIDVKRKNVELSQRTITELEKEIAKGRILEAQHRKNVAALAQKEVGIKTATNSQRKYNQTLKAGSQIMGQFRGMLISTFGAYALVSKIKNAVSTIKEFEAAMARVGAISGATGDDLQTLSDIAKNISIRGSIFDPKTVAELQIELAKLGFTVREIGLSTRPIVNLATAMGEDLARAAEVGASTLRSFNLEAGQMEDVINVMGKAFSTSALDMSRWSEAAKYAAPVANQMKWNVRDLAATMGVLANRQIFGSLTGTSLRNVFSELADKSSELSMALGGDINNFNDFVDALVRLNEEGTGFGKVLDLVEKRTSTTMLLLIKNAAELKKYRQEFENTNGVIEEMADKQLVTLAAQIKQVGTAWKAFINGLDEGDSSLSNFGKKFAWWLQYQLRSLDAYQKGLPYDAWIELDNQIKRTQERIADLSELYEGFSADARTDTERFAFEMANLADSFLVLNREQKTSNDLEAERLEIEKQLNIQRKRFDDRWERGGDVSKINKQINKLEADLKRVNNAIYVFSENTNEYSGLVEKTVSPIIEDLADKTKDELDNINADLTRQIRDFEENVKKPTELQVAQQQARIRVAQEINNMLTKMEDDYLKDKNGAAKDEYKRRKEHLALMRKLEEDRIKADENLSEQEAELALEHIRNKYDTQLYELEAWFTEDLKLRKLYNDLIETEQELHEQNLANIDQKYDAEWIKRQTTLLGRRLTLMKRIHSAEIRELDRQIKEEKDKIVHSYDERLAQAERISQLEYEKAKLSLEGQIEIEQQRLLVTQKMAAQAKESGLTDEYERLEEEIQAILDLLKQLGITLDSLTPAPVDMKKQSIADFLKIDPRDWDVIVMGLNAVSDALRGAADAAVEAANAKVDASNRAIAELQRDLEIEMGLAEQGFASNVSLKRKMLEEEKRIRDENIEDQKKAQQQQLLLQSVLDAANLVSTVVQIALMETKTKGLAGLIAAAVGAAGVWALYANVSAKSKQIASTKYEKGGYEILQGKSHRQGGISLGEGREAEGGEMFSVFNKKATKKYGKHIAKFTDLVNKDNLNMDMDAVLNASKAQNVIVNMDDRKLSEIHSVLKEMRDNDTFYTNGYKIVKQGGRIRKIKNV